MNQRTLNRVAKSVYAHKQAKLPSVYTERLDLDACVVNLVISLCGYYIIIITLLHYYITLH